jgi:hypothetical protein
MSKKLNIVVGGIANSFATKISVVTQRSASQTTPTVHIQQTTTVNTYRFTSVARTFVCAPKTHHLLKQK